jgi:murein DD-endopeptidase MepM/ murein hydrolase activator NlpD
MPAARDPRMDRPVSREVGPPDVVLWVPAAPDEVRPVDPRSLARSGGWVISLLMAVVAVQGAALALTVPAWSAFDGLVAENLALRGEVQRMDARVDEAAMVMAKLAQYHERLKSLVRPRGSSGGPGPGDGVPIPEDLLANAGLEDDEGGPLIAAADTPAEGPIDPLAWTPAESWAADVSERLDELLDRYRHGEADIDILLGELESLSSVQSALPQRWPADGRTTSGFGWRSDPIHRTTRFHAGLDIANDRGTPIFAVAPGVVIVAETQSGYGRVIDIDHGFGITTRYAHCTTLRVAVGERVEAGDFIATMGSTGKSTGPHLHFELRIDEAPHDPIKYLR